jgi:1-deoxy-D-xylulose-5-phosphate reductoisomerase
MVEYIDSSIIAQLSVPDMRLPILYSLSYPERIPFESGPLNFSDLRALEFYEVDTRIFTSIRMAFDVLSVGKNSGVVLNAANEVAVDHFLKEIISFKDIFTVVEEIFYNETFHPAESIEDIETTIKHTKVKTADYIKRKYL